MKYVLLASFLCLSGCSTSKISQNLVEHKSNIQVGNSPSYCNQTRMQCSVQLGDIAGSNGHYSEWKNKDGSIGCSCNNQ
jgi:hypothetical protein